MCTIVLSSDGSWVLSCDISSSNRKFYRKRKNIDSLVFRMKYKQNNLEGGGRAEGRRFADLNPFSWEAEWATLKSELVESTESAPFFSLWLFSLFCLLSLAFKSWSWEEEAFKENCAPGIWRTSPNKALGCQMLPKTQRPAFQDRLAAGHHRMNTCSNTRQARRWKAEVKTEEVDGRKDKW